ncbi:maleylpyruvate isomerase family mycothiol-dependent enzyme [Nocardioides sp. URHA0032]|uniref:maleylpyruvate isomerase family mycothiol-dependent enzyme n=1 Tax=Nocardioides sp. URHA0032 TaxID=1380388 RepID=UPI0018CC3B5B|nr:maleylpyruvate isomerase family mycothiol-dependent enzyme [Nocardioides sp. URHA0032]
MRGSSNGLSACSPTTLDSEETAMPTQVADHATVHDSRFDHQTAMALAAEEYTRFADTLVGLAEEDWQMPTSCTGWTIRDMAGHTLGMAELAGSLPEMARQLIRASRAAKRSGKPQVDELTDLQVRKHEQLRVADLVGAVQRIGPKAVAGRRRRPALMRAMTIIDQGPDGASPERWKVGFLTDTILTRDPWMHRSDIAQALGRPMKLTREHDGVVVADVVAEWALRHGQPFDLILTGPAGGRWTSGASGASGEAISLDAEQFCRILSGRGSGAGLMATFVPF